MIKIIRDYSKEIALNTNIIRKVSISQYSKESPKHFIILTTNGQDEIFKDDSGLSLYEFIKKLNSDEIYIDLRAE